MGPNFFDVFELGVSSLGIYLAGGECFDRRAFADFFFLSSALTVLLEIEKP